MMKLTRDKFAEIHRERQIHAKKREESLESETNLVRMRGK